MELLRKLNKLLVALVILILLFSMPMSVMAENEENDFEIQMNDLQGQKDSLQNAISANEAQIGVVEGELSATLEEIETLSSKIDEKKNEILALEKSELSLINFIEKEETLLKQYTEEYEKSKAVLEKRLIVMYEMGETTYLDVLLKSKGISDFLSKYYLLAELGEADYKLVSSVKKAKSQTENVTKTLAEKKEDLEKNKEDLEKYQISLSNMEILKINKLSSLSEEEMKLYNEIEAYRTEIANVEAEIKELALKNLAEIYIGGSMIWPTPGYTLITSPFGMRTHPITGIYKLHTGMDIGAPYGSNFVAMNDGVVVAARMNSAYGNMVMIDHGGGVVSLYAHGSEICVSEGDIVRQGQVVLKIGSTGYSTGPHAHVEIRINGEYINPADCLSPTNENSNNMEKYLEN